MADRTYYQSNELIPRGARVVISGGKLSLAGASEEGYGTCGRPCPVGAASQVDDFDSDDGAFCRCDTFIAAGATVYAAAGGLVDTVGSVAIGTAKADSAGGLVAVKLTFGKYSVSTQHSEKLAEAGLSPTSVSPSDIGALADRVSSAESAITILQNKPSSAPVVVAVTGSTIDLSTGSSFTKTLAANTTLTLSGGTEGQSYRVTITNPSTWTLAWSGVLWTGTAPTQSTGGKVDVYEIFVSNGQRLARRVDAGWSVDSTKPTYVSGAISADGLTFNATMSELVTIPTIAGVTLTASGGAVTASAPSDLSTVVLAFPLSRAIQSGETVTVSIAANAIQDLSANGILAVSGGAVTNGSTAGLSEGLESPTVSSGWAMLTGGTWNDTAAPIVGNASLKATGTAGSSSLRGAQWTGTFPDNATGWEISGVMRIDTAPTASVNFADILLPDGSTVQNKLRVNASLGFGAYNGSDAGQTVVSAYTATLGTPVYFWITRPAGGTGVELRLSATSSRPSTANYTATGTNVGTAGSFRLTTAQGGLLRFDEIRLPH